MWAKARRGEIEDFTGLSAPYEAPDNADVVCETHVETVEKSTRKVLDCINKRKARALYIGRWQPFHDGHRYIIQQSLDNGVPVLIAVRDMLPDKENPFSAEDTPTILLRN